jgi:hypothetical protein
MADGGLVSRAPVLEALDRGAGVRRAIVAASYATGETGRQPTGMRAALEEAFETAMVHQIARDVELARRSHPLDFEPERLSRAFDRGVADARACVERQR